MATKNSKPATGSKKAGEQRLQLWISVVLVVVGVALLICGFFTPPPGEIHGSVLIAFGEILTWVGTVFGMHYNFKYKLKHKA